MLLIIVFAILVTAKLLGAPYECSNGKIVEINDFYEKKIIFLRIFENKYEGWLTPVKTDSSSKLINSSTGVCISV